VYNPARCCTCGTQLLRRCYRTGVVTSRFTWPWGRLCWLHHQRLCGGAIPAFVLWGYVTDACKMHTWSLHFTTWYSTLFASYIGYIHAFWWLLEIIHMFPNFIGLTWENQKISFSMFLTFMDPNGVQITWNFTGASSSRDPNFQRKAMWSYSFHTRSVWNTSRGRGTRRSTSSLMSFTHLNYQVSKPSYMAIKKAFYGRQPGCFCFDFLCVLFL
jgi:hypothetical protein